MQYSVETLLPAAALAFFGTTKSEAIHQPGKPYVEPSITANGRRLNVVNWFTCLGSMLSQNVINDDEVNTGIAKAKAAFGGL